MARTVVLLTALISVLLTAFAWPSVRSHVHDVPIAVAGPPAAVKQVSAALDQRLPGCFAITEVADTSSAERLIRDREVYGAIDVSSGAPQVITASAAGAGVAPTLQGVAVGLGQAQGPSKTSPVRDIVALPADDPRGAGLTAGALPLVMGGLLAALLLTRLVRGIVRQVAGALIFAINGGLAVAAILQFWLGSLDDSYLVSTGAIALAIAAASLTIIGLESQFGYAGFGLGAVTMMLIGNPLSGASTAPEMLPGWSGTLGQLLPPGMTWLGFGVALCMASGLPRRERRLAAESAESADNVVAQPSS